MRQTETGASILFIDTLGAGHQAYNRLCIQALLQIGTVTPSFRRGYHVSGVDHGSIAWLPPVRWRGRGKLRYRLDCLHAMQAVVRLVRRRRPTWVILSSFETISTSLVSWLLPSSTFLIDHNNVEELGSPVKRFFYRRLNRRLTHVAFLDYIRDRIRGEGQRAVILPFPVDVSSRLPRPAGDPGRVTLRVFSPSGQQDLGLLNRFIAAVCGDPAVRITVKRQRGGVVKAGANIEVADFFPDYDRRMAETDVVLVVSQFTYRVSGVAYEALGAGVPVIIARCRFSQSLRQTFGSSIIMLDEICSGTELRDALSGAVHGEKAWIPAIGRHSVSSVASCWKDVFEQTKGGRWWQHHSRF